VTGESFATLSLKKKAAGNQIVMRVNGAEKFVRRGAQNVVKLRVAIKHGGLCMFSFAMGDDFVPIPRKFAARKGVWLGAKLGLYSLKRCADSPGGHVDIDYFRFM